MHHLCVVIKVGVHSEVIVLLYSPSHNVQIKIISKDSVLGTRHPVLPPGSQL